MGLLNWFGLGQTLSRQAMANMPQDDGECHPHRSREESIKVRKARRRNRGK